MTLNRSSKKYLTIILILGIFVISLFNQSRVFAASCSWNGSTNGNWGTASNWDSGCTGAGGIPGNGDSLIFPASASNIVMNNNITVTLTSITFQTQAYTLNGSNLVLTDGIIVQNGANVLVNTNIILSNNIKFTTNTSKLTVGGEISGNYNLTIQADSVTGAGVTFNHANSYVGTTTIINAELDLQTLNSMSDEPIVMLGNAKLLANVSEDVGPIEGTGKIILAPGILLASVYPEGSSKTFSGTIEGSGDFARYGIGDLILTGNSPNFTGHLYNWEGLLTLNGNISNAIADNQGGEFGGIGTYGSMGGGNGFLSPGNKNSIGTMNIIGNLGMSNIATLNMQLTGPTRGGSYDQINVTGNIEINDAILNLDAIYEPVDGSIYTILKSNGEITGTFTGFPNNTLINVGGKNLKIVYTNKTVQLIAPPPILYVPILTITPSTETFGNQVNMKAQIGGSGYYPTGTVTFMDATNSLATVDLLNGEATYSISNLSVGTHNIKVVYSGNAIYPSGESPIVSIIISNIDKTNEDIISYPVTSPIPTVVNSPTNKPTGSFANQQVNVQQNDSENNSNLIVFVILAIGIFCIFVIVLFKKKNAD